MTIEGAMEFTVDNLPAIRSSLASEHQQILDLAWDYEVKNNDGIAIRSLAKVIAKKSSDDVLDGIGAYIRRDYNSSASKAIKLNVLGILLTKGGSSLAAMQIMLLDTVRQKFDAEVGIDQIQCTDLPDFEQLSDGDLAALLRITQANGLIDMPYSYSGHTNDRAWQVQVKDHILEFLRFDNSQAFLDSRLIEAYARFSSPKPIAKQIGVFDFLNQQSKDATIPIEHPFVSKNRIEALEAIRCNEYDCTRLIVLCKELNDCYAHNNVYAVAMLTRAVVDHIAPVFGDTSFKKITENFKHQNVNPVFKSACLDLQGPLRKAADRYLHSSIREKEVAPDMHEVRAVTQLESVLAELCRLLKHKSTSET